MADLVRTRGMRLGGTVLTLLAVLLVLAGGVSLGVWKLGGRNRDEGPVIITHLVQRGLFEYEVVERGEVESSSNVEVRCEVRSRGNSGVAILELIPEGTYVEKGDVLVRLDSSAMDQEVVEQQIKCNSSQAQMIEARNKFEAAKIALEEYTEGIYVQDLEQIKSEIFVAEENLRRAREYVVYSQRLAARGYVTSQQLEGDEFAVEQAATELNVAKTKRKVLTEYARKKTIKQLESDIRSAEANWQALESSYALELTELADEKLQVEKCVIVAPQAGQVVYASQQSSRRESEFLVELGALVRESQVLIRLPDPTKMQVKAKINESRVTSIRAGMPATIRLDAFGDDRLEGEVIRVNEYPEPGGWYSSQVKEYGTFIKIANPPPKLRPGLTAEVTIHVQRTEDVLMLPVQAVYEHGRDLFTMRRDDENDWTAVPLQVGATNDQFVHIKEGVSEGDVVAMNPRKLLDQVDLPALENDDSAAAQRALDAPVERQVLGSGQATRQPGQPTAGADANHQPQPSSGGQPRKGGRP